MSISCAGFKNGKYQIEESEPGVKLNFIGQDAEKFEQHNAPKKPTKEVKFSLTVAYLRMEFAGFLPLPWKATR